jgi:glycosyltransferase involved in cell wall biosynthesis
MISILIPTKNEEQDLPGCLESVRWSDDIHVYDSGSTDATAAVASRAGAAFYARPPRSGQGLFGGNEAEHKNWALANLRFKHEWVFTLDADERVTPELAANIQRAVRNPGDNIGFRIQRRDFWQDRWLRHVQTTSHYLRVFRPEKMRYARLINPVSIPDGPVGELSGYLNHHPFSKGMTHWLNRHNSYSTMEARQIVRNREANQPFSLHLAFFSRDATERRFHQKELFYRLPARPFIKFLLLYIGKKGFLDGSAGFQYAMLQSFYEYMIVLKTKELTGETVSAVRAGHVPLDRNTSAIIGNQHANTSSSD